MGILVILYLKGELSWYSSLGQKVNFLLIPVLSKLSNIWKRRLVLKRFMHNKSSQMFLDHAGSKSVWSSPFCISKIRLKIQHKN